MILLIIHLSTVVVAGLPLPVSQRRFATLEVLISSGQFEHGGKVIGVVSSVPKGTSSNVHQRFRALPITIG
jgi:hypothetical protein